MSTDVTAATTAAERATEGTNARIAELVAQLTGCNPAGALATVSSLADDRQAAGENETGSVDAALELVARAVFAITEPSAARRPTTGTWARKPPATEGMRLTGYVRTGGRPAVIDLRDDSLPRAPAPLRVARYLDHRPPRQDLVEHGSLRRWERPFRSAPITVVVEH